MTFRSATPLDLGVGMYCQHPLYDLWGRIIFPASRRIRSYQEQRSLLSQDLWIWDSASEIMGIPFDHIDLAALPLRTQLAVFHDRLRLLLDEPPSLNFPDLIWQLSEHTLRLAQQHARSCFSLLRSMSQPGNALLNSLHAGILSQSIGLHLPLQDQQLLSLGSAALTMNWSILDLQDHLNSKGRSPSASERHSIMNHPAHVELFLRDHGVVDPIWLQSCRQHHEEPDGRGYPDKLVDSDISLHAKILRIADRYVALVSSRSRRQGMSPPVAFSQMQEAATRLFDPTLLSALRSAIRLDDESPSSEP